MAFNPELSNWYPTGKFRFWCQKVLPLVYDDSLSYYELLCKVVDYLNKYGEDLGMLADEYKALVDYVNHYFDSDLGPVIEQYVDEWLVAHPEVTTTVQDNSLDYKKLIRGTLGFVTPEMFGAVGDGNTDDTQAINDAINSGATYVAFLPKTYVVSKLSLPEIYPDHDEPCVSIYDKHGLVINGNGAKLKVNAHAQGIIEINDSDNVVINNLELEGYGTFPPIAPDGRGEKGSPEGGYYTAGYDWESHKNNSVDTSNFTGVNGNLSARWGTFGNGYIGNAGIGLLVENGCSDITIENVKSHGFNYSGISVGFRGHESYPVNSGINIINCECYGMYDNGINVILAENVNIEGNIIYNIGHPNALPNNAVTQSGYQYQDPGYGITMRKPNTVRGKASKVHITNNFINNCVRKGVDSHGSDMVTVDGNTISLCYVAGIEASNGAGEETWTTNYKVVNNVIKWCGANGNGISVQTVTDGSASVAPSNYPYNVDIVNNTLKECGCNNNGIIWVRCGRNITVDNNIIDGTWSIANMQALNAIRVGQSEMNSYGFVVTNNKMNISATLSTLIFATAIYNSVVTNNMGKCASCDAVLSITGDCVISNNDLRADSSTNAPSVSGNTSGKTFNNILTGSKQGMKILHGQYTISSTGAVVVQDSDITANSIVLVQHEYSSSQGLMIFCTVQPRAGDVVVYLRKNDGTIPTGNIYLNIFVYNES